jgi:N-acetylmuramate 1-kinase
MPRLAALRNWLDSSLPATAYALAPASADASFRRYFRLTLADGSTRIVMDAPPEHEDCRPFIHVAGLLAAAGLNAPRILSQDLQQGFLLLSDLGHETYLQKIRGAAAVPETERSTDAEGNRLALSAAQVDFLFRQAIDALVLWQKATQPGELPPYDEALLRRELGLFPEWFIGRHLGVTLSEAQQAALDGVVTNLVDAALQQPRVYVHRDFMPRNLMVCDASGAIDPTLATPGILDFQDAVEGPITYDIASLCRDAFISWDDERVLDWTIRYWEKARKAGLPVDADFSEFWRRVEWMGLQRHLKVLGIFCRLNYRDGKAGYLADLPRFLHYARTVSHRYSELAPLFNLLEELVPQGTAVGYTF